MLLLLAVSASHVTQLQSALISPQQLLKPKLAKLEALPGDHPFYRSLQVALDKESKPLEPAKMVAQMAKANSELYDVIGQLAIALQQAAQTTPGYDVFADHELHAPDADSTKPTTSPATQVRSQAAN